MNSYKIPNEQPKYHFVKSDKIKKALVYTTLDKLLTVYGFLLVFGYSIILFLSAFHLEFYSIFLFIIFWLMLTYIAFPRLHSFFANMYLPNYFLSRTKTGNGILGDPVNMALLGAEEDIHAVMQAAGWTKADPITIKTSLGIALSTVKHKPYPAAPVSDLYLFGKKQDFAYQLEVNGSASQRHHVRFWKVPEGWCLPGGEKVEWLAAGTYDKGVGLTSSTLQITHKIDKYVDKERDYIIESMLYVDNDVTVDVIEHFSIPYSDENGGGDAIETDGSMPIVNVTDSNKRVGTEETNKKEVIEVVEENDTINKELPPKSLVYIGVFVISKIVLSILVFVLLLIAESQVHDKEVFDGLVLSLGYILDGVISLVFYILILKKHKWSRLIFLLGASIACTMELVAISAQLKPSFAQLIYVAISLSIVLILSSLDIREWVYTVHRRGEK